MPTYRHADGFLRTFVEPPTAGRLDFFRPTGGEVVWLEQEGTVAGAGALAGLERLHAAGELVTRAELLAATIDAAGTLEAAALLASSSTLLEPPGLLEAAAKLEVLEAGYSDAGLLASSAELAGATSGAARTRADLDALEELVVELEVVTRAILRGRADLDAPAGAFAAPLSPGILPAARTAGDLAAAPAGSIADDLAALGALLASRPGYANPAAAGGLTRGPGHAGPRPGAGNLGGPAGALASAPAGIIGEPDPPGEDRY